MQLRRTLVGVCLLALGVSVLAQTPSQRLVFEVASIKVLPQGQPLTMTGAIPSGARLNISAMSTVELIAWANNIKVWSIAGGPPWAGVVKDRTMADRGTTRFDIAAKAEGDAPRTVPELREMMGSLLAERFQLVVHRETRDVPAYALVVDKGGPKFKATGPDASGIMRFGRGTLNASGGTMDQLANYFSNANGIDRPIVDRTGLTGKYDFALQWAVLSAGAAPENSAPSIFAALPDQLGLKLDPQTAPVEFIVIDHVERPSED